MDVKLPPLGEGADSGTVVNLLVKEGDQVAKDQPLLELENEKAVATIPSSAAGTVSKLHVKTGDKISVGQRILSLSPGGTQEAKPAESPKAKPKATEHEPEEEAGEAEPEAAEPAEPQGSEEGKTAAASPAIRKLAQEIGLDLARIRGTARGGRITMDDVRGYIQRLQRLAAQPRAAAGGGAPAKPAAEPVDFSRWGAVTKKPLSPTRQVIARRMTENWNAIPHVTQFDEADITGLLDLRKKFAGAYEKKGTRLTVTPFILKAVAATLKKHPIFNSSLDESANEIVFKEYVHIGVAVDTEGGLVVPVLRDADKKNLLQLSKDLEDIAVRGRERKISGDEMKGGSFTISNQGGIGGAHFTPIVNKPEVAILGLGKGALKAVAREGKIEPRTMLPLALSYDHRVIDGGAAARFIVDLVEAIQSFKESDAAI